MALLRVASALAALPAAYAAYAYHAYSRVRPAARPCRGCPRPARVGGYDLYYRELGADRGLAPVVLLHGGPGHSSLSFKGGFDFLAAERRVIAYDQRGSGNSQVGLDPADYTVAALVEELEALRREVVGAEQIVLVGHSFGGALAQRYALAYPGRVERLVLVGAIRINNGMRSRPLWRWLGPALYGLAMGLPPADPQAADAWLGRQASADSGRLFDSARLDLLADSGPISFVAWRELARSLVGPDYRAELGRLRVPTLFIYGAADSPFTGRPVAAELCATLPDCRAVAFERSGHWPFLEEPERFQQVLRDFIGQ